MRVIVAITGASGAIYGIRLLQVLADMPGIETHLVISAAGEVTISYETEWSLDSVKGLADVVHDDRDITASIGSGSFQRHGMVIAPCSIKTLSAVANSHNDTVLIRSADATLKERKKLVLVVRETPFNLIHLRHMVSVTEAGGIVLPPLPAFYTKPRTIEDILDHTVGKILDVLEIEHEIFPRWQGVPQG